MGGGWDVAVARGDRVQVLARSTGQVSEVPDLTVSVWKLKVDRRALAFTH